MQRTNSPAWILPSWGLEYFFNLRELFIYFNVHFGGCYFFPERSSEYFVRASELRFARFKQFQLTAAGCRNNFIILITFYSLSMLQWWWTKQTKGDIYVSMHIDCNIIYISVTNILYFLIWCQRVSFTGCPSLIPLGWSGSLASGFPARLNINKTLPLVNGILMRCRKEMGERDE